MTAFLRSRRLSTLLAAANQTAANASMIRSGQTMREAEREGRVGLCPDCRHVRVVRSRMNQDYYRCERSTADARYPKYPRLPVLRCDGYDPVEPRAPGVIHRRVAQPR